MPCTGAINYYVASGISLGVTSTKADSADILPPNEIIPFPATKTATSGSGASTISAMGVVSLVSFVLSRSCIWAAHEASL